MRTITSVLTIALVVLLVSAFATRTTPKAQDEVSRGADIILDDQLLRMAQMVPGIGGMFFDENRDLNVYMVGVEQRPEAMEGQKARIAEALTVVLGKGFLGKGKDSRPGPLGQTRPVQSPQIKIIKGRYDISQLSKWRPRVDQALDAPGVVLTDLDERQNRLKVGIEPGASREQVEARLRELGVPLEMVTIEETKPITPFATVRDMSRPVTGGVQIDSTVRCTLGFNAVRNNIPGFVTNSHCTIIQGAVEGTQFFQPSAFDNIGYETADPVYFTGGVCPTGRRCRYSDSAFVRHYDPAISGFPNIARTTVWTGSITINSTNPTFQIVSETAAPISGTILDKVGRTTGWTFGQVIGTCENTNVLNTDITLLCQNRVSRTSGTNKISDFGDSGSPVFRWPGSNDVSLYGILWGGNGDDQFVFSSMGRIEQELGSLTTFNAPPPPPSPSCPSGRKCCEPDPNGGCLLCVPNNASCP